MISCQIALYPLASNDFTSIITKALEAIEPFKLQGLTMEVGPMSTVIKGKDELVWKAVQALFAYCKDEGHKVVLNASFSNECGCDL